MARNPQNQQQPAPAYLNDPTGVFTAAHRQNATAGIQTLLPASTAIQNDVAVKCRLLAGQIGWTPTEARWNNCNLVVSLQDTQFDLILESGGDMQQGRLMVIVEKSSFNNAFPSFGDTFKIKAKGIWHEFNIAGISGQHDDNEPAITLALEKDQNDDGN